MGINRPIMQIFYDASIFLDNFAKMTSHDVILSEFEKKFEKYSSYYYYCVAVQIWCHLYHLKGSYGQMRYSRFGHVTKNK